MFLGQLNPFKEENEPQSSRTDEEKSSTGEAFLKTPEAKDFIRKWTEIQNGEGKKYTRRGITSLLLELFPNYKSNRGVLSAAEKLLRMLGGMDGLQGFLMGWKAKSEGLMKSISNLLGGE